MPYFNIVAQTTENTVVTEYAPVSRRSEFYQSEAELEKEFIRLLCEEGYTYITKPHVFGAYPYTLYLERKSSVSLEKRTKTKP